MIDLDGLLAAGCASDARIGIGAEGELLARTERLLRERGCRVELEGFDDPVVLVDDLRGGRLDAGVRGALSSVGVLKALRSGYSIDSVWRTAVLSSSGGRPFMLTPVGIDEGRTMRERLELVRATVAYFRPAGWQPIIGVLSGGRPEDAERGEDIRRSLEDGWEITEALRGDGLSAEHHHILVERAAAESELVVAPDGVTGNLMFRTLHFVGSGRAYGAPVVNLRAVFVDTSRAKADFAEPVLLAAGLADKGCGAAGRA